MPSTKTKYRAPALEKGLEILEYLARQNEPQTIAEITEAVSKTRNEIYRMLLVLEQRGYLVRAEDGDRLMVSNKLFELGIRKPPLANLHSAAMPEMHELAEDLFQSSHLAVRSGDQIVCVARVESPGELGFSVRVGFRRPILRSTSGVILYAFMPKGPQRRWLTELAAGTASKEEVAWFEQHAEEAREKGYIVMPSGFVEGIQDIGAPVFDSPKSGPIASLTLPFVSGRSAKTSLATATEQVALAAKRISAALSGESVLAS